MEGGGPGDSEELSGQEDEQEVWPWLLGVGRVLCLGGLGLFTVSGT